MEVGVHEAKTNLSRLLKRVATGEEVVITNFGRPVARLVPPEGGLLPRRLGIESGKWQVPDDFDAPLPAEVLDAFEA
jgi:prevent-host-death family protein